MFQIGIDIRANPRVARFVKQPAPHVFVIAGSGNASGRAPETDAEQFPTTARHWSAGDSWAAIGSRLYHGPWETGAIARPDASANFGWARSFATAYQIANPDNPVHLIGIARDGAGLVNSQWTRGSAEYQTAVARVNSAMSALPDNAVLAGILWHQGEADSQTQAARNGHATALAALVGNLREDIDAASATTPFVVGGHFPLSGLYHPTIQSSCQSLPNSVAFAGYADPSNPVEVSLFDGLHADAPSLHALGLRYLDGLSEAAANTTIGSASAITTGALGHYALPRALVSSVQGVALGAPAAERMLIVAVTARADTAVRPIGVRVGGTPLTRAGTPEVDAYLCGVTLFYGRVPTGSSATLDVTFDTLPYNAQAAACVLPVYGARMHPASARGLATIRVVGNTTAISATVAADQGDLVFACAAGTSSGTAVSSVNLGQTLTTSAGNSNYGVHSAAGIRTSSGDLTVAYAFDRTVARVALSTLVLRPA
ncbi:sialate O-acetylesterase [Defluviimonas sp. WL0002]|uniref:Sialate O-acetylesterase n=1 Tax=Albidovulum marisflavi TaxID=2984159 RepID=A0ABT2Z7U2_9RHOB|nr:sialate O-acetylesterase [Defluviimonas sp. WL0002]MCV2867097.1 sialate O-acetylesterase [Defluviimonas sp. WL0002]